MKEKIIDIYVESVSKRKAEKLILTEEIAAAVGNAEKVRCDIQNTIENGGKVFIYKRKREIKVICIFSLQECMIPLAKFKKSLKEVFYDMFHDKKENPETELDSSELVSRKCLVMTGFYIAKSYEIHKEELEKVFKARAKESMMDEKVSAFIWNDEITMKTYFSHGNSIIALYPLCIALGMIFGIIIFSNNIPIGICMGLCFGSALGASTVAIGSSSRVLQVKKFEIGEKK